MSLRIACLAVALTLAAVPAAAQIDAGATVNIEGTWSFTTDPYDADGQGGYCQMVGELTLRSTPDETIFDGKLVAYESCFGVQIYEAHQNAVVVRNGDQLSITSALHLVLPSPDSYAPDNFELSIVNGALMVGELRSADIAPATFRRKDALVS